MKVLRWFGLLVSVVLTVASLAGGMLATATPAVADDVMPVTATSADAGLGVGIQMFMYNWNSVASECTSTLGPEGIKWVLVMPPQEHIKGSSWWTHYQPVSYQIESRLGTRAEFAAMAAACNAAGVKVIADAVINHMSSSGAGVGWAGTSFTKYDYPGLYSESDFHPCHTGIVWGDPVSVRSCELLGLADLDTGSASVQGKIVGYLKDLLSLGVSGFRIDAAKHIAVSEVAAIRAALPAGVPFLNEVYNGDGILASDYLGVGDYFDFQSGYDLKAALGYAGGGAALAVRKQTLVALPPSDQVITMVTNHDTERSGTTLTYADGKAYQLALEALLTQTYGQPMLFSGFSFVNNDDAPVLANGKVTSANCAKASTSVRASYADLAFTCEQRWKAVRGMVAWHNFVGSAAETNVYGKRGVYGVGRGSLAHFALNSNRKPVSLALTTSLAPGVYCDLVSGGGSPVKGKKCVGAKVRVDAKHRIVTKLAAMTGLAITSATKLK